ncbi:MAG: restriction endonuclease [Rhodospirillales bacterium]|nr:restriction endonuclease [Rhodospirillales bacterium]
MVKAILTTKVEPNYDDLPEVRYHFPRTYLNAIERAVGDWILYYEPRRVSGDLNSRGGRQAYFATAMINHIEPDPKKDDHFYAYVSNYLELGNSVPFKEDAYYFENVLQRQDGNTNKGAFGRSVRNLPDNEYDNILAAGFTKLLDNPRPENEMHSFDGLSDNQDVFNRPIIESVVARPFRDIAFRSNVRQAYGSTCAMTGVEISSVNGLVEVEAAHIQPVKDHGPDTVRNGLSLSRSIHWMFDRGLLSAEDDGTILMDMGRIPPKIKGIINSSGKLILPQREELHPHSKYLSYHRENVFNG